MQYQILRSSRPAIGEGVIHRYYAIGSDGLPIPCSRLATIFLEKHIRLGTRKKERAYDFLQLAISDCLTPSSGLFTTQEDQESAAAWFFSEGGEDALESIGLNAEFVQNVITKLSTASEDV